MSDYNLKNIAIDLDAKDKLAQFRGEFHFPKTSSGEDFIYLAGNSLGLQPKKTARYIEQELVDWQNLGVEGHLFAKNPWLPYHELLCAPTARLVGALESEVVVMNSLTVNLHLMMLSFYQPQGERTCIMIEGGAFPSDQYAVKSQLQLHGLDPSVHLIELHPRDGEDCLRADDILARIEEFGPRLALIMLGNVNYRTGQCFDMAAITKAGHKAGAVVGFDLAHGAGNLELKLHDDGPDFAVWCSYKYLNAGPGGIAGAFVHERHHNNFKRPRLAGWWGHNKAERFKMGPDFDPISGAEGWQLSNPPIFQLAALRASVELFDEATMPALRAKADQLTQLLERALLSQKSVQVITPSKLKERGTQLSLRLATGSREIVSQLQTQGVICDFREPDIVRVAPVPLYTRFLDVVRFAEILDRCLMKNVP